MKFSLNLTLISEHQHVPRASVILYPRQVASVPQSLREVWGQQEMGLLGGEGPKLPWASPPPLVGYQKGL